MGQIVSIAAKPKRCNLNQLNQVPTPAAGEHILVSSDNSMNAAGQGNFDCYIVGDGSLAAEYLELKKINPEAYVGGTITREINFNEIVNNQKYISRDNVWVTSGGPGSNTSVNIPVTAGDTVILQSNNTGAIYALLKSNTVIGVPVDFSSSAQGRIVLSANAIEVITIPSDCTLLYVFTRTDYIPSKLIIRTTDITPINEVIPQIEEDIEKFSVILTGEGEKEINLSDNDVYQNFINSSYVWNNDFTNYNIGLYNHYMIPTKEGTKYLIKAGSLRTIYAFLADNEYLGTPSFVTGYAQIYYINANSEQEVTIPEGCNYLYIYAHGNSEDFTPAKIIQKNNNPSIEEIVDAGNGFSCYKRGLLMGDSISAGVCSYFYNNTRYNSFYAYRQISYFLSTLLGCPFDNVAKRGSGYVADTRNINNAWEQAQAVDYANYDIVVMMYGVNDYIQHSNIGTLEDETEGSVTGNMKRVFNKILSDNPSCKIICVGSYNCWGQVSSGGDYTADSYYGDESTDYALGYAISGKTLRDYLNIQKAVCEKYHIQFYCLADSSFVNSINIKNTLVDGLHPTAEVREYMAQEIAKNLI